MRSDVIKKGAPAAPNRSLLYALGYTKEELERPLIGVVCSYNEIVPGHMNLDKIAEAVKAGIRAAGGTPVEFPAIAVCDGIAMGHVGMKYSLVTRDLIADSTEAMAMAHQFDGLVMIPNCDKNVPGLLMAAARVNIPTIFVSGGPMMAGTMNDGRRTCLSHMFEAVGSYYAGKLDEAGVEDYENNACPTCGSCLSQLAIALALNHDVCIHIFLERSLKLLKRFCLHCRIGNSFCHFGCESAVYCLCLNILFQLLHIGIFQKVLPFYIFLLVHIHSLAHIFFAHRYIAYYVSFS